LNISDELRAVKRVGLAMALVVQGDLALLAGPPLGAVLFQALSIGRLEIRDRKNQDSP
jgi:hypothetical protein